MAGTKVHTFPTVGFLSGDFRVPFQYQGPGSFAGKAFSLTLLKTWLEENLSFGSTTAEVTADYSLEIPANKWAIVSAIQSDVEQNISIGTTPGGTEYGIVKTDTPDPKTVPLFMYGGTGGATVYFSGIGEFTTITTLIF